MSKQTHPHSDQRDADRRAVLAVADGLFYERGIAAVSMADIRDAAGLSLRRVYAAYDSKRELVATWLADRDARWMRWFITTVERLTADGADPLVASFYALGQWASTPGFRGCPFLNTLAETGEIDDTHRAIVVAHKQALIAHLAAFASARHRDAPDWLAPAIAVLIDGAIAEAAALGTTEPIVAARHAAIALVDRT